MGGACWLFGVCCRRLRRGRSSFRLAAAFATPEVTISAPTRGKGFKLAAPQPCAVDVQVQSLTQLRQSGDGAYAPRVASLTWNLATGHSFRICEFWAYARIIIPVAAGFVKPLLCPLVF